MKLCLPLLTVLSATTLATLSPLHIASASSDLPDHSSTALSPAAPLFPELSVQQPLKFSLKNEQLINSVDRRKKEWDTTHLPAPSWLAIAAICTSFLIFYTRPLSKKGKIIKVAPKLINGNSPEEVYSQLIDCLRHHLNEQWEIAAMSSSLPENMQAIDSHPMFNIQQKKFLKESLAKAELIKFNQITTNQAECKDLLQQISLLFPSLFKEMEQEASQKKN